MRPSRRVVDIHTHFLASSLVEALERRQELPRISEGPAGRVIEYGEGNVHPELPAMGDLELRLRDMDEAGIDLALISLNVPGVDWFPPEEGEAVALAVNDELADVARAHPDRLAALAALPMQSPQAAAAELERALSKGLRGAMVHSNVAGRQLDEPELGVVFDTAARLGAPIYIHPTYPLTAKTVDAYALIPTLAFLFDTTTAAMRLILGGLFERHPDFKLVLSHAGSLIPYIMGRIDYEAERDPQGHGAISVRPSEHIRVLYTDAVCVWPPALRLLLEVLGADRVMLGTDYPFWEPGRTFAALDEAGVSGEARAALERDTAERLFGLP